MAEYEVPRQLDEPDQVGIPLFTTAQFFWLLAGVGLAAWAFQADLPGWLKPWLCLYLPLAAILLPRSFTKSGWTAARIVSARLGRWCRSGRALWKPR